MNRLTIIGNLTNDPELRTTAAGKSVCSFTVAVNRRKGGEQEADFFRVSAWEKLGENCGKFLVKGRKVAVVGPASLHTYTKNSGETGASLEVMANEVEFLSGNQAATQPVVDKQSGFEQVSVGDELPFLSQL